MQTQKTFYAALVFLFAVNGLLTSCKSAPDAATSLSFCDTVCFRDTLHYADSAHPLEPYVFISPRNCNADTITWGYGGGGSKTMAISDMIGVSAKLNKSAVSCFVRDTSYAWLAFNDCSNGRGYLIKLPFNKGNMQRKTSAINSFDPKFNIQPNLAVYSDRGNLFVEDMKTGKQAIMTFGKRIEIDYDALHEFVDSVNVTPTRMWARVRVGEEWKEFQKDISLK